MHDLAWFETTYISVIFNQYIPLSQDACVCVGGGGVYDTQGLKS